MPRALLLEPIGGIAGDMFLALCVDLGLPIEALSDGLGGLGLGGWRFALQREARHGIEGTHLDVVVDEAPGTVQRFEPAAGAATFAHAAGPRPQDGEHRHGAGPVARSPHAHRSWASIRQLIETSAIEPAVRETAIAIFARLARAEAKVHGFAEDDVVFHEVGAVDSIVDIVGAALAWELLGRPEIYALPPPLGSGLGRSAHGPMPIPPPATLELLAGWPARFEGRGELTTPTGAAILATLARQPPFPEVVIDRVGYGVGTKDFEDRPNVLRGVLGDARGAAAESLWVLEANLDDATPQLLAWALERALAEGALDAWVAPIVMKKGRPGHLLGVLCDDGRRRALSELLVRETPTLGVRAHAVDRVAAERQFEEVETPYGRVRIKLASLGGALVNAAPEFEDCARLARELGEPLKDILAAANAAATRRR